MISLDQISSEGIKDGALKEELPEFYDLIESFEKNAWHNETTFDHVLMVLDEYDKFVKNNGLEYLDEKVDTHTKKDLLKLAILLHDIGKKDTLIQAENGDTSFPNHETVGARKSENLLIRFDITESERDFVLSIILNHSEPHNAFDEDVKISFPKLKIQLGEVYHESLILAMVDTIASKLCENKPEEYQFRIETYNQLLEIK